MGLTDSKYSRMAQLPSGGKCDTRTCMQYIFNVMTISEEAQGGKFACTNLAALYASSQSLYEQLESKATEMSNEDGLWVGVQSLQSGKVEHTVKARWCTGETLPGAGVCEACAALELLPAVKKKVIRDSQSQSQSTRFVNSQYLTNDEKSSKLSGIQEKLRDTQRALCFSKQAQASANRKILKLKQQISTSV